MNFLNILHKNSLKTKLVLIKPTNSFFNEKLQNLFLLILNLIQTQYKFPQRSNVYKFKKNLNSKKFVKKSPNGIH